MTRRSDPDEGSMIRPGETFAQHRERITPRRKRFAVMLWHDRGRFSTLLGFVIAENAPHAQLKAYKKWPQHRGSTFARHAWGKPETDPNHYTRSINFRENWRAR